MIIFSLLSTVLKVLRVELPFATDHLKTKVDTRTYF